MTLALALLVALATPAEVARAAEAHLADRFPEADVEVEAVRLSPGVREAAGEIRVRLPEGTPRGRVSADVEAEGPEGWHRVGWAYLQVSWFETGWVLARDVPRGDPVAAADLVRERVETTALRAPLAAPPASGDWRARRALRAGAPLTDSDLEAEPVVGLGDPVRIEYRRGDLVVHLDGEAREPGALGEVIHAYCSSTRTTYRVRLTAPRRGTWVGTL